VAFDPVIPKEKEVILETNYVVQGDEAGSIIDKENIINAYYYGPQLVPISPILEAGSKVLEDKNFRLLGFIDKSKVPRHAFMSDVDIVVPGSDNIVGRKLFTAFIYSMIALNKYGLARYIPRNSKNGVTPKMVVLMPYRSAEREMFYLVEMPTVEDVRQYPFNPLKQSSTEQKEMVKNMVSKMMLFNEEGDEEVKVENTFNPLRQYFYQSIFYRALNDAEDLPPLDPVIKNYMTP
jgi:ATP-dependent DNA helicase 2 subunit 2